MSGMLIAEYILRERRKMNTMPEKPALVETIVTTDMAGNCEVPMDTDLIEVLTGFKYIGEQIRLLNRKKTHHFVFGLEESYGCLAGTRARQGCLRGGHASLRTGTFYKAEEKPSGIL